jgi:RNA polymerase sigma-70 factor (ECF subfamily)
VSVRGLQRAEVERLYEAHGPVLLAYACTFVRSVAAAEDVVHQVFARLLGEDLMINGPPLPYLCRAVRNAALNDRRSRAREETLGEEVGWLEAPPRMEDSALAVEQAMALLPPEQREVVVLHIWGGLTFQEVAEILTISPNTAASRYRYALGRLRETMKPVGQT